jgi:hypothetical protein
MEKMTPFEFRQSVSISKSTGKKAGNLRQLRDVIAEASEESIVHHTYQYFLKGHMLEYTNDFAEWAGESLGERALAEHLSNIDPYNSKEIGALRSELLDLIDGYLDKFPNPKDALPGDEFYLNETVTLIFPMGIRARNLAEFLTAIKYIEGGCIYYHFYEARIRLGGGIDDFSKWFEDALGEKDIAAKIRTIDPLMYTTEQIRTLIAGVVEEEVRRDMEVIQ